MIPLRPRRLGMLVPSSNTVLEPETQKLLPLCGGVTVHVSRLRVTQISDGSQSRSQFDFGKICEAADLLADAAVDLILWNGTAASWLGFDHDTALVAAIRARTGITATTAVTAINETLATLGATRIGLVTPYIATLEADIIANYAAIGIETVGAARLDLTVNTDYAAITPDSIAAMARGIARPDMQAIVIMCTNLAGASIAPGLSDELNIPVLDAVRVAVEHSLRLLTPLPRERFRDGTMTQRSGV